MSYQLRKCYLYINIGKSQVAKSENQERKSAKGTEGKDIMGDGDQVLAFHQQLCLPARHPIWPSPSGVGPCLGPLGPLHCPVLLGSVQWEA